MTYKVTSVRLPPELHQRLRRLSFDTGRSMNELTAVAIEFFLDEIPLEELQK